MMMVWKKKHVALHSRHVVVLHLFLLPTFPFQIEVLTRSSIVQGFRSHITWSTKQELSDEEMGFESHVSACVMKIQLHWHPLSQAQRFRIYEAVLSRKSHPSVPLYHFYLALQQRFSNSRCLTLSTSYT
jgi:hypothetical protein